MADYGRRQSVASLAAVVAHTAGGAGGPGSGPASRSVQVRPRRRRCRRWTNQPVYRYSVQPDVYHPR